MPEAKRATTPPLRDSANGDAVHIRIVVGVQPRLPRVRIIGPVLEKPNDSFWRPHRTEQLGSVRPRIPPPFRIERASSA